MGSVEGAPAPMPAGAAACSSAGGRRISIDAGTRTATTSTATICSTCRQSCESARCATHGDMVSGATPKPAETSDTARLRCVENQPVTHATIGAKIAEVATPTSRPKASWNPSSDGARLASSRPTPNSKAPIREVQRAPMRSLRVPHAMLPTAMARNP